MRVLISGLGSIGKRHSENLKAMGHEVIVYDPILGDWAESFSQGVDQVSHVVIASPANYHAQQAITALLAGKEVFIEKPMALNAKEGQQIMEVAKEAGKTVAVGYQWAVFIRITKFMEKIHEMKMKAGDLTYCGDRKRWPGSCYDDLLLECSHEIEIFFPLHSF